MPELAIIADAVIVVLAFVALVVMARMPTLFAHGATARPLKVIAVAMGLLIVAEGGHIAENLGYGGEAAGLVHELFEMTFFVLLIVAGIWFARAWQLPARSHQDALPATASAEAALAGIVTEATKGLAQITGPAFADGSCRRVSDHALANANPEVRAAVERALALESSS